MPPTSNTHITFIINDDMLYYYPHSPSFNNKGDIYASKPISKAHGYHFYLNSGQHKMENDHFITIRHVFLFRVWVRRMIDYTCL